MRVIARQNRDLVLINAQNTQNENDAEKITLQVPEQYEDFNKKIVFVTPDGNVWDIITNNEYLIKKAITKYKQVDFYIWLTKDNVDFRSQTKTLKFYQNVDASDEITDEEIGRVNIVVNLLEEEITKVENLESQIDGKLEEVDTAIDNIHTAIQETENLDLDAEKEGQTTTVTLTKKDGTVKTVHIDDGYDDTEIKNDISKIKEEQTTQNENISTNANEITNLKNENSYLQNVVKQAFTETSASGTELTINNTIEAKMNVSLYGNTKQDGEPTPDTPIPVNVVTGDNTIDIVGKNLFNSNLKQGARLFSNGNYFSTNNYVYNENPIAIKEGETYTLSANNYSAGSDAGFVFFNNGTFVSSLKQQSQTFTAPNGVNQVYCDFATGSYITPSDITNIQLEKGNTPSTYEEYKGTSYNVNLGSLELCKIGNYQDYFYKNNNKWYKREIIGSATLDGLNWTAEKISNDIYRMISTQSIFKGENEVSKISELFCNIYKKGSANTTYIKQTGINLYKNFIYVYDSNYNTSTSVDSFKTMLKEKNAILYGILSEPRDIEITDTTLITQLDEISQALSQKGTTIISQSNDDLPFNLDVIALTK